MDYQGSSIKDNLRGATKREKEQNDRQDKTRRGENPK